MRSGADAGIVSSTGPLTKRSRPASIPVVAMFACTSSSAPKQTSGSSLRPRCWSQTSAILVPDGSASCSPGSVIPSKVS